MSSSIWVFTDTVYFRVEHWLLPLQGSFFLLSDLGSVVLFLHVGNSGAHQPFLQLIHSLTQQKSLFFYLLECFLLCYSTTLTQRSGEDQSQNKCGGSTQLDSDLLPLAVMSCWISLTLCTELSVGAQFGLQRKLLLKTCRKTGQQGCNLLRLTAL